MYTSDELQAPQFDHKTAMQRFLHKFLYHRKEFKKFKSYEKHYAFDRMKVTYDENKEPAFNLYDIEEAREYVFYSIILCYGEAVDSFSPPLYDAKGKISAEKIRRDKRFFNNYLSIWKEQIKRHKGAYLNIIVPMLNEKLKELRAICSDHEYKGREKYCYAVFFYIYYKAQLYFDGIKNKCVTFDIQGFTFVINIYSFCHIFNRHYIPSLNRGLLSTMNIQHDGIDIQDLPNSLKRLIMTYCSQFNELSINTEYMLFNFDGFPYILWIKYKSIPELNNMNGFEVRTYYRCEEQRDLEKFDTKTQIQFAPNCYIFI